MNDVLQRKQEIDRQIQQLLQEKMKLNESLLYEEESTDDLRQMLQNAIEHTAKAFPERATVACQGVEGAYSEAAARKLFKEPGILYFKDFNNIFDAIESGLCEYGILPIENSTVGSVNKTYDLLMEHRCFIVRSVRLKINHSLMALPGTKAENIMEIYSHQQAFDQSEKTLRTKFKNTRLTICSNTAEAAKKVSEAQAGNKAAICSPNCAALYGLETVATDIQDNSYNYTRFICFTKKPMIYEGADKTSFLAVLPNKPGSLYEVLKKFNDVGYNLIKLESRPIPETEFQFMFYFDFEASIYHNRFIDTLCELDDCCEHMEYLGSYNEKI